MNYFRQLIYDMRHQALVTWITVAGTALAIFLVMVTYMSSSIAEVPVTPESRNDRILYGRYGHFRSMDGTTNNSGGLSYETARRLYEGLDGVERVSYTVSWPEMYDLAAPGEVSIPLYVGRVDDEYWRIYDYVFIEGAPFDREASEAGTRVAVMTRAAAEEVLGRRDRYVGSEVTIDGVSYHVCGIVKDLNPLRGASYNDLFIPATAMNMRQMVWSDYMGPFQAVLLLSPGVDRGHIAAQVKARYATVSDEISRSGMEMVYHQQPYTPAQVADPSFGSNSDPSPMSDRMRWGLYALLLLLPAINLSSMTRSRLRHRVSEIGVRRAFGCPRLEVVGQLLGENLLLTVMGALVGLAASLVFMTMGSNLFLSYGDSVGSTPAVGDATPDLAMLFSWQMFGFALLFCFVLNLLSAGVPAWRASSLAPAEAIGGASAAKY